jgi:hypothetical protein
MSEDKGEDIDARRRAALDACMTPEERRALLVERYRVLVALGADWRTASRGRYSAARFVQHVSALGGDPSRWPQLTVPRRGGWPRRLTTPRALREKERYHALRGLGASAEFASRWCRGAMSFETAKAKLARGAGKR